MKSAKEIALDKLWNILIALIIGETTTAFHYGLKKIGWLLVGFAGFIFLLLLIAILSYQLAQERKEEGKNG